MVDPQKTTIKSYDRTVDEYIKNTQNLHPKKSAGKFLSFLKPGSLILDLGCGYGRDSKIFTEKGYKVVGVDLSKKMIEEAKRRLPDVDFRIMDIRKLDFEDEYFDGVWASAIFFIIPKKEIAGALKETYRVLKKSGVFYLSLKEGEGEGLEKDKRYGGVEKYCAYYKFEEVKQLLEEAGFELVEYMKHEVGKRPKGYDIKNFMNIICRK